MTEIKNPMAGSDGIDRAFECESCSNRWYYTRARCTDCGSTAFETYPLETGRVMATTTVHATPPGVRAPNRLALVQFDGGIRLIAQVRGPPVSSGDSVEFGDIVTLRAGDSASAGPSLQLE
ncbi:hypothetical protein HALLA_02260 (plasmid) [Halostagnicola larsenii XH-48]|uniref:ChsH2 C-terminal OB-fold domain-containing protein n=1 Tax=Halostagnicola larsenii XH-48 TaxID=797299 RepID=W0JVC0_9EURY|nr:OB-fold domain-containing protein [Halostagnicola larsenii]AHG01220.1 hypothetical protein HALLA_02260 [Halostagnicola larsenii XH-48]